MLDHIGKFKFDLVEVEEILKAEKNKLFEIIKKDNKMYIKALKSLVTAYRLTLQKKDGKID